MLRKFNAYLGYIMAVIFIIHGIEESLFLQGIIPPNEGRKNGGLTLMALMIIHMIITAILIWKNRKSGFLKPKVFEKNGSTYIQRYTGAALIIMAVLHGVGNVWVDGKPMIGMIGIYVQLPVLHCIMEVLFVIIVCVHLNISLEKAAVTLGWIRGIISRKVIKNLTTVIISLAGLFSIYGFVCYYIWR